MNPILMILMQSHRFSRLEIRQERHIALRSLRFSRGKLFGEGLASWDSA